MADQDRDRGLSRRALLVRGGALALALTHAADVLRVRGALGEALAADADVVRETFAALMAFTVPGPDPYSVAQGEHTREPGGVDGGAAEALIATLDRAAPPLPTPQLVAGMLNSEALAVAPAAAAGPFAAPFARLTFAQKAEVFRRLDAPDHPSAGSALAYLGYVLLAAAAQHAYNEAGVFDRETRTLRAEPVGWRLTGYTGPSDGAAELVGYWHGHRSARTAAAYAGGD